jgi:hypothetical protein
MLGALNGLDELFSLVNILGFLPECDLFINNTFTLARNKVVKAAQGAKAKDFEDFVQNVRKELGNGANARIALKNHEDNKYVIFTLCEDTRKMKKLASKILKHLETNHLLPNVAFPPLKNYVEYSLEIKQISQYLQPFNLDNLKRMLDQENGEQDELDVESDASEEENDVDVSVEVEQESSAPRQKKRGRPRKNQIVSIDDFLSALQRKSSEENSRKKQKTQ